LPVTARRSFPDSGWIAALTFRDIERPTRALGLACHRHTAHQLALVCDPWNMTSH
jgi:hypothetical protein